MFIIALLLKPNDRVHLNMWHTPSEVLSTLYMDTMRRQQQYMIWFHVIVMSSAPLC